MDSTELSLHWSNGTGKKIGKGKRKTISQANPNTKTISRANPNTNALYVLSDGRC